MRLALLAALALLLPGTGAVGAPPELPRPTAGELFYYTGARMAEGHATPLAHVVRVVPEEVLDREGGQHAGMGFDAIFPAAPGMRSFDDILQDPEARHVVTVVDARTRERLEVRLQASSEETSPLFGGLPVMRSYAHQGVLRALSDPGQREPFAELWGAALPAATLHEVIPAQARIGGYLLSIGSDAFELAGVGVSRADLVRAGSSEAAVPLDLAFLGAEPTGWHYRGTTFDPTWRADAMVDVWFRADSALPVQTRLEVPSLQVIVTHTLAEHRAGGQALPWDAASKPGSGTGELGPMGATGPDDGSAGLAFPLRDAVRAALADPTLFDLQLMRLRASPVLTKAFYEVRAGGEVLQPLPEARWYLIFQDAQGQEVHVEAKRPLGAPVSVQREIGEDGGVGPDIVGVRPDELPALGATLGAATEAWRERSGGPANAALYELQRAEDGTLRATVWAGRFEDTVAPSGDPGLQERWLVGLVGVDADGLPRFGFDVASAFGTTVQPAAANPSPGLAPPAAPLPIAAASVGIGLAVGAALKILGPLYTRLDRRRVLAHPLRQHILRCVEQSPGLHMEALQAELGAGAGSTAHHVEVLARAGLLRVHRAGRYRRVYPPHVAPERMAQDAALRVPRSRALFDLVQARPGVGLRAASRELGVPVSSLQWHVLQLEQAGLLQRRREGMFVPA